MTFKVLFVFVVLAHARRRVVHFNITEHPTAQWTAQQVSEAFPWEAAPRFLVRDRDRVYGPAFKDRVQSVGVEEVLTAPRCPWQNPFAERLIGSIRRECLEHVVVLNERHLRRLLGDYLEHYHRWRCHRSLMTLGDASGRDGGWGVASCSPRSARRPTGAAEPSQGATVPGTGAGPGARQAARRS